MGINSGEFNPRTPNFKNFQSIPAFHVKKKNNIKWSRDVNSVLR